MQDNEKSLIVNGIGGMGKSELINYWVRENKDSYEHIVYLSCGEGISSALSAVKGKLQHKLALDDNAYSDPDNVSNALVEYDNLLLVLDNLPWQDSLFDKHVEEIDNFCTPFPHILASSRRQYDIFEDICSERSYYKSKKKFLELELLIKTPFKDYYILNPLYILKLYSPK